MSRMLDRLIGEHIAIDLRLASDLWPVRADAAQLEQVLVNLALNARDAMPQGGGSRSKPRTATSSRRRRRPSTIAPGPFVELRVRDTGVGIPPDVQGRIFEPFFTTKPKGAGTGLGLSMVYGFVQPERRRDLGGQRDRARAPRSRCCCRAPTTRPIRTPTPKQLRRRPSAAAARS